MHFADINRSKWNMLSVLICFCILFIYLAIFADIKKHFIAVFILLFFIVYFEDINSFADIKSIIAAFYCCF